MIKTSGDVFMQLKHKINENFDQTMQSKAAVIENH